MENILKKKHLKIINNAEVEGKEVTTVRYYKTDIVVFDKDQVIFNRESWKTPATKKMINLVSSYFKLGWQVVNGADKNWWVDFFDETTKEYTHAKPWLKEQINLTRNPFNYHVVS